MKQYYLVAPDSVGIIALALQHLRQRKDVQIDFTDLVLLKEEKFKYKNLIDRAANFYNKTFKNKNNKHLYYNNIIKQKILKQQKKYDAVIVIRPDLIDDANLACLRSMTRHFVAYYWDSADFFPRKKSIATCFDKVYSFDKADCKRYGYELLTNFFISENTNAAISVQAYGLLSFDKRKEQIEKIAAALEQKQISYCVKAYSNKPFKSNFITPLNTVLDYKTMLDELAQCNVIIEVQKAGQQGLTFRPFEALGMEKKIITTNPLIKEYDFYCPENICVVDTDNIVIPDDFFSTPYKKIDSSIKNKYNANSWFNTLISTR
jgi:hypothetical protein